MPDLLQAEDISKHYGGVYALKNALFSLRRGEVHALMGENGAGKSTLAKIIAGSVQADDGRILIDGEPAAIRTPLDAQRLGIGIIYQELDLFPHLSVGENIVIGNLEFPERGFVSFRKLDAFCRPFLDRVGLRRGTREILSSLSIGQMQLVALARALSMNARIILMDEPTSSLVDDAADRLFHVVGELKQSGVAIVYVSHKMDEIFRICDCVTVLRDGETVGTREIGATNSQELIRMMVGRDLKEAVRRPPVEDRGVILSVTNLTTDKLRDISFELHCGEVLGVAGLVGSGRSELGAALFGIDRLRGGVIRVNGQPVVPRSPSQAIASGIGLLPEDRKLQGLMMQMSVSENSTLTVIGNMQSYGLIRRGEEQAALDPLYGQLALKCTSRSAQVSTLSGGNQQKALLARWLLVSPDILFLDDPARGIDVGAKQDIYRIIDDLAAAGKGVILVSSELPELLRCCDRILVLNEGRLIATYDAAEATQEQIMTAATNMISSEGQP
ncbi:MAG: sugar ABC transporter ATP-binding protein [Bryobacteraceae bacterium]